MNVQKMLGGCAAPSPDPTPRFVKECCLSITEKRINYQSAQQFERNNQYDAIMTSSLNVVYSRTHVENDIPRRFTCPQRVTHPSSNRPGVD